VIRLALRVPSDRADQALAELLELVPAGVEEVDLGDVVEFALYGAPGELPSLPSLETVLGGVLAEVHTSEVPDDWSERWRAFHRPVTIGGRLFVRPPWEPPADGLLDVVIDPGQAFGTGAHETTRLCLQFLLELPPAPLVDLGTGSGVLAIAAAKLGFGPVLAVDHDPASVDAARENALANGVEIDVRRVDLRREHAPPAAVTLANLVTPMLLEIAPGLPAPADGALILSGILRHEADAVAAAFADRGWQERSRASAGDWTALALRGGS
jgi:ribosomal protein L11 methyltransferase